MQLFRLELSGPRDIIVREREGFLQTTRRDLIGRTAAGLVLAPLAGGALAWLTPAEAAVRGSGYRTLSPVEAAWLAGLGEAIAPPSRAGGLDRFVDHHVTVPPADSLLALRYLDVPPPYADFYRPALMSLARRGAPPPAGDARWSGILGDLAGSGGAGWSGPPPPLFLFAVRLDAIDIAYGTRAGFARLGVDYLPHIEPEADW